MRHGIIFGVFLFGVACFQTGCGLTYDRGFHEESPPAATDISSPSERAAEHGSEQMQRRFESGQGESSDAAGSVVVWAQRYEELSVKNNMLREKNGELILENTEAKQRIDGIERELEKTKKDLAEANEFLRQMHVELSQWKGDVLGFRDEMRQAQKAQIEALAKILRVLDAESITMPESKENELLTPEERK